MRKLIWLATWVALGMFCSSAIAQGPVTNYCVLGAKQAAVSGLNSTNYLQGIIRGCTVTVYLNGTTTPATLFSNASGTPLGNPFTANATTGQWLFYASTSSLYDVVLTGGISPNTYPAPVTLTGLQPGGGGGGGSGCTPGGATNSLQKNNGSGGCGASSAIDNGSTFAIGEPTTAPAVNTVINAGTNLATAVTACGSANTTIQITQTIAVGTGIVDPPNCTLLFQSGGMLTGTSITIHGKVLSAPVQIFGAGLAVTGMTGAAYPEWFGAKAYALGSSAVATAAAGTNDATAAAATIAAIAGNGWMELRCYAYHFDTVAITTSNTGITGECPSKLNGSDIGTVIVSNSAGGNIVSAMGASSSALIVDVALQGFYVQRAVTPTGTAAGIYGANVDEWTVRDVQSGDSIYGLYSNFTPSSTNGGIFGFGAHWGESVVSGSSLPSGMQGIWLDSSGGNGGSSLFIYQGQASCQNVGSKAGGILASGISVTDFYIDKFSTGSCNIGIDLENTGTSGFVAQDVLLNDNVMSNCVTDCLKINGMQSTTDIAPHVYVKGGNMFATGTGAVGAFIENSTNISLTNVQMFGGSTGSSAQTDVVLNTVNGFQINDNNFSGGSLINVSCISSTNGTITGNQIKNGNNTTGNTGIKNVSCTNVLEQGNNIAGNGGTNLLNGITYDAASSNAGPWSLNAIDSSTVTTLVTDAGTNNNLLKPTSLVAGNVTDSALTSGNCVQASTGGLLTTTGSACGSGGSISFPQTVGGTVNSGGLVYANSGTQISVSPAGTAGQVVLWGGAGTAPGAQAIGTSGATLPLLNGSNTWSGQQTFAQTILSSYIPGASSASLLFQGAPFSGGSGSSTVPLILSSPGLGPTTWSTGGTFFGVSSQSGFTGNFLDFHVNGGASVAKLDASGNLTVASCTGCGGGTGFPITLGSTSVAASSTTTTIAGLTLTSPTFSGTVAGANTVPLSILAQSGANTMLGNWTSGTANVVANTMPSCTGATNALGYTNGTGIVCNGSITAAAVPVTGITGMGTGVATFLATPSSANLLAALTTKTGAGSAVFSISPALTGTPDASGATQFKLPVAGSFATLANGELGYDTTAKNWHIWGNAVDNLNALVPVSVTITNTHCAEWLNTAGVITLTDSGGTCGGGGSISFPQTVAGTTTSGGIPYFSSVTVLSSSALLPTGDFVLGGGAGGAPTASFSVVPIANGGTGAATAASDTVYGNETGSTAAPHFTTNPVVGSLMSTGLMYSNTWVGNGSLGNFLITVAGNNFSPGTNGTGAVDLYSGASVTPTTTVTGVSDLELGSVWGAASTTYTGSWSAIQVDPTFCVGVTCTYNGSSFLAGVNVSPTFNMSTSSTKGYALFYGNPIETSVSTSPNYGLWLGVNGTAKATIDNKGTMSAFHLAGIGSAPTIAAGTGAGTGPTVTATLDTDMSGYVQVLTGTVPSASAAVFTITFSVAYATAPKCKMWPDNAITQALTGIAGVQIFDPSVTVATATSGATALVTATTYKWGYSCTQ